MTKYKHILGLSLIMLACFPSLAQQDKLDSLQEKLQSLPVAQGELRDTARIRLHNTLAWQYYRLSSYDTASFHVDKALMLLDKLPASNQKVRQLRAGALNNRGNILSERVTYDTALQVFQQSLMLWQQLRDTAGMANVLNNMGIIYDNQGHFDKSIEQYNQALELRRAIHDLVGVADAYNNLGVVYHSQGRYQQALVNYLSALEQYRRAGDLDGVAYIYNNIGMVYQRQEQYAKALENYEDALNIRLEIDASKRDIASTYANIAGVHMDQAQYETALRYDSLALGIFEEIGDQYRIASILNNMGIIYGELGNVNEAIAYGKRALAIKSEMGARKNLISTLNQLCELHIRQGLLTEARAYCDEAVTLAREVGSQDFLLTAYRNAAHLNEERNTFQQAVAYLWQYVALKDSLSREEYSSQIAELSARYENEKKEREIALQKSQLAEKENFIKKQNLLIWGISTSLLLVVILAIVSFRLYRSQYLKGKIVSQQKAQVEKQNSLLDEASREIEQRNEELTSLYEALSEEKYKVQEINKDLEAKVLKRTQILRERNEQLKQYAFFNAHRFRGPVANILGLTQLANSQEYTLEEKLIFVEKLSLATQQLDLSIREIQEQLDHEEGKEDISREL